MFYLTLFVLEGIVLFEAYLAYRYGLLSKSQVKKGVWDKPVLAFTSHGGMWGDFFIVSPMVAWVVSKYSGMWGAEAIVFAFVSSLVIGSYMFYTWTSASRVTYDPFSGAGKAHLNGWIHWGYAVICFSVILLFYFGSSGVTKLEASVATFLLAVHILLGIVQPEYAMWGRVSRGRWIQFFIVLALLFTGFGFLYSRS